MSGLIFPTFGRILPTPNLTDSITLDHDLERRVIRYLLQIPRLQKSNREVSIKGKEL